MNSSRMNRHCRSGYSLGDLCAAVMLVIVLLLWGITRFAGESDIETKDPDHLHRRGAHGGRIVSFAEDALHAEVLLDPQGMLSLYTFGRDETEVLEVAQQKLVVELRDGRGTTKTLTLTAKPTPGDAAGHTSRFVGSWDAEQLSLPLQIAVENLQIQGKRYRWGILWEPDLHETAMPDKVTDSQEEQLYLTPGGLYTAEDIAANGHQTASQALANFQASHDFRPQSGDRLCPITRTKAHPQCSWVIGGKTYQFCCPPCIDEFLQLAKSDPAQINPPEEYIKP